MPHSAIALVTLLLSVGWAGAHFVIEESALKVVLPPEAKTKYFKGFDMALANFGAPRYGGALRGRLVYIDAQHYTSQHTCSPPCGYACQDFASATPPVDLRLAGDPGETYIMLVDRGPNTTATTACKFAEKVWNVQSAGARGAIVVNYEDALTTMEAPDDDDEASHRFLTNITIPAAFVTRATGEALKGLLKGGAAVYVSMDWTDLLPKKQQVHWEFWTNSNDQCGSICDVQKQFIKQFVPVAKEFDAHNWTVFEPHYIVWVCPSLYRSSDVCRSQCIRQSRYCSPDPDGNLTAGYSGRDVVQENLRQLCVFKLASDAGRAHLWWDYVTAFGERCDMQSGSYGEQCALKVFDSINADRWSSRQALTACVGQQDSDAPHPIMDAQLAAQKGDDATGEGEVWILPTIRINGIQYRGKMATAEVLRAICAGFAAGNTPEACSKAVDDPCMQGSKGYQDCTARLDGKTQCIATFAGYNCTCGKGYLPHVDAQGVETCLDLNECLSVSQLDPKCTCPRCACNNTRGGYECITDIPDECASGYGGCWHADLKVGAGPPVSFSACKDNLPAYKRALARGLPTADIPLHTCTCPPCFTAVESRGVITCTPKCDLRYCDLEAGVCHADPSSGGSKGGVGALSVVLIVLGVVAALGAAGYAAYQLRIRSIMQQEVRAILAQYMRLDDTDADGELAAGGGGSRLKQMTGGGGGGIGSGGGLGDVGGSSNGV
ncbi:hypothetical protein D9Q98_007111 [Chlorella vulgaris]|uniref:PA domain-containing protein n=1 Tax=Chlorella vulgaris TaxID=3077 RepID=A0A9D4YUL7_CHLVU|nr:hypothetical protein D9Q98_007111 [Chlorella vulgaris]